MACAVAPALAQKPGGARVQSAEPRKYGFSSICSNAAAISLSSGSPTGGVYSGTGVSNGMFNQATAGVASGAVQDRR